METIYCIANQTTMEAYVGRTYQMVGERWTQHIWGAWKGKTESRLAEAIRHAPEDFEFLVLEQSETASEAQWMQQLKSEGWTLLNETGGNRRKPRKRDTEAERAWRAANDAANGALNAKGIGGADLPSVQEQLAEAARNAAERAERFSQDPAYRARAKALDDEYRAQQTRWAELRTKAQVPTP